MAFKEPNHFKFSTGYDWRSSDVELGLEWRSSIAVKLKAIEVNSGNPVKSLLSRTIGLFRQGIFKAGLKLGPVKVDGTDQQRIHAIVTELDTRRVFYEQFAFEDPRYCVQSVLACRDEHRRIMRGVWADKVLESLGQDIQHQLARFLTDVQRYMPSESAHWRKEFEAFIRWLYAMRLEVWADVALIIKRVGPIVTPAHMPRWIVMEVDRLVNNKT